MQADFQILAAMTEKVRSIMVDTRVFGITMGKPTHLNLDDETLSPGFHCVDHMIQMQAVQFLEVFHVGFKASSNLAFEFPKRLLLELNGKKTLQN